MQLYKYADILMRVAVSWSIRCGSRPGKYPRTSRSATRSRRLCRLVRAGVSRSTGLRNLPPCRSPIQRFIAETKLEVDCFVVSRWNLDWNSKYSAGVKVSKRKEAIKGGRPSWLMCVCSCYKWNRLWVWFPPLGHAYIISMFLTNVWFPLDVWKYMHETHHWC